MKLKKFNPYITAIIGLIGPLLAIFDREGPSILGEELFTFLIIFGFVLLAWSLTKIIQLKNIKLNELWLFITSIFIFFLFYNDQFNLSSFFGEYYDLIASSLIIVVFLSLLISVFLFIAKLNSKKGNTHKCKNCGLVDFYRYGCPNRGSFGQMELIEDKKAKNLSSAKPKVNKEITLSSMPSQVNLSIYLLWLSAAFTIFDSLKMHNSQALIFSSVFILFITFVIVKLIKERRGWIRVILVLISILSLFSLSYSPTFNSFEGFIVNGSIILATLLLFSKNASKYFK